jgi:endonuclease YncB( thermonuclease family)
LRGGIKGYSQDRYGRTLSVAFVSAKDVNLERDKAGYASLWGVLLSQDLKALPIENLKGKREG